MKSPSALYLVSAAFVTSVVVLSGCSMLDRSAVQATSNVPESVRVAERGIPYSTALPRFLLLIEPVRIAQDIEHFSSRETTNASRRYQETNLHKQREHSHADRTLDTTSGTLLRAEIDSQADEPKNPELKAGLGSKQRTLSHATFEGAQESGHRRFGTEQNKRQVDYASSSSTTALSNRAVQISTQLASAFAQVKNFAISAGTEALIRGQNIAMPRAQSGEQGPYLVRAILTEYHSEVEQDSDKIRLGVYRRSSSAVRGVVAFDLSVTDPRSNRVVAAFPVRATFSSAQLSHDATVYGSSQFAQSTIDQALRIASYDAAQRLFEELRAAQ